MAAEKDRVMEMVQAEMAKNPSITSEELYRRAQAIDASIANLKLRQFHARYPLQVKRLASRKAKEAGAAATASAGTAKADGASAPKRRRGRPPAEAAKPQRRGQQRKAGRKESAATAAAPESSPAAAGIDRDAVRAVLLQFAQAVVAAEGAAELVKVVGNIDKYVDSVAKAAARGR
ncbi:MAG TPA: hypothetical protein VNZ57_05435 [Longimicrobiales bacterium]|nr:hypothetical protein [Longimicrobiales bacterium]